MDSTQSSKTIVFLAFQMTQNKHNGPTCHATFLFLPTKEPLQPKRVSFTEKRKTQDTPKKKEIFQLINKHRGKKTIPLWRYGDISTHKQYLETCTTKKSKKEGGKKHFGSKQTAIYLPPRKSNLFHSFQRIIK